MDGTSLCGGDIHPGLGPATAQQPPPPAGRIRTGPDPSLIACRCFSFITSLAAILCIAVNVLSAIRSFKTGGDVFDGLFRCYAVVIAVFVVVAETEWEYIMKVMTRAYPEYLRYRQELFLLQSIAGYMLLGCGVDYVISGIFCIGMVKRAFQKKELSRVQAIKDLAELERRREELDSLLLHDQA